MGNRHPKVPRVYVLTDDNLAEVARQSGRQVRVLRKQYDEGVALNRKVFVFVGRDRVKPMYSVDLSVTKVKETQDE